MALRIDQLVECISGDGVWWPQNHSGPSEPGPSAGDILRVTALDVDKVTGETYLLFAEWHGGYIAECFRPLVRSTDISIFQAMLKTPKPARRKSRVRV